MKSQANAQDYQPNLFKPNRNLSKPTVSNYKGRAISKIDQEPSSKWHKQNKEALAEIKQKNQEQIQKMQNLNTEDKLRLIDEHEDKIQKIQKKVAMEIEQDIKKEDLRKIVKDDVIQEVASNLENQEEEDEYRDPKKQLNKDLIDENTFKEEDFQEDYEPK